MYVYEYSCPCCACVLNSKNWDTSWSFKRCRNSEDVSFDKFIPLQPPSATAAAR